MVRPAVAPTIPLHCRDEFMVACRDLAAEFDVGIHTHLAESKIQAVVGVRRYGGSLTTHVEQLGLLGPRFVAAHGVWLDGDDMRRLGAHGASIAHNPASNMRLGNGVADAVGMLEAGVNLAIGTDAATCNDNLNMYQSLHFAAAASHARGPDPARWITAPQVFAAATTGSARALGFERIGRIAPGYAADIVFLDLDAPTLIPLNEPTTQMVMGEDGTSVVDVMVGGRFVVRDRRLLTVDLPALAARAAELRADIDARSVASRTRFDAIAPVLCDFCPALAGTKWHINRWCGCECGQE
jgi:guanine deaminase